MQEVLLVDDRLHASQVVESLGFLQRGLELREALPVGLLGLRVEQIPGISEAMAEA